MGKITIWNVDALVSNIPTTVCLTPCPPRLQHQTMWTGSILTKKMTIWRVKCLAKVVNIIETVVLNTLTLVRITS